MAGLYLGSYGAVRDHLDAVCVAGLPARYDASLPEDLAGVDRNTVQTIRTALRRLGFLDGDRPTPLLHDFVDGDDDRRVVILADRVRVVFADVFALPPGAGRDDALACFGDGVNAQSRRKSLAFMIQACDDVGIDVPIEWRPDRGPSGVPRMLRGYGDAATQSAAGSAAAGGSVDPLVAWAVNLVHEQVHRLTVDRALDVEFVRAVKDEVDGFLNALIVTAESTAA